MVRTESVRPGTRTTQTRPSGSCATWSGVWSMRNRASPILEGLEEILTVIRLGLPHEPGARSPANIVENALDGAPGHPQRSRRDGAQMDRRRPAGGPENFRPQGLSPLPILRCSPGTLEKGSADSRHHEGSISSTSDACPTNFNRDRDTPQYDAERTEGRTRRGVLDCQSVFAQTAFDISAVAVDPSDKQLVPQHDRNAANGHNRQPEGDSVNQESKFDRQVTAPPRIGLLAQLE